MTTLAATFTLMTAATFHAQCHCDFLSCFPGTTLLPRPTELYRQTDEHAYRPEQTSAQIASLSANTDITDLSRGVLVQVDVHEADTARYEQQLNGASAEKSSLQSQLQAADMHIHSTDTQLQASRLNMGYLKVRQQLSQTAPALSYVQAYEVSCGLDSE